MGNGGLLQIKKKKGGVIGALGCEPGDLFLGMEMKFFC